MTAPEDKAPHTPPGPALPTDTGASTSDLLASTAAAGLQSGAAALTPGTRLGDHYRVVRPLGRGGMGAVYLARDERLGRDVAIKLQAHAELVRLERLRREAQALAQLSHPNVVAVYEVVELEGQLCIAMEYVDGWTLGEWLGLAPRGVAEIVAVLLAAGRGLAAAHSAGLVHRDFKPANLLVGRDGRVRVADFGLARRASEPTAPAAAVVAGGSLDTVTADGAIVGTPAYMAPEQRGGTVLDARTDQFAFCLTLYQALEGRLPDQKAIERATVPFDGADGRRVPAWLRALIRRGLQPAPQDRFPSMDALLAVIETTPRRIRRRRTAVGLGLGLLALAGAAWLWRPVPPPVCPPASHRLLGVWDNGVRQRVSQAFSATHTPFARASLDTVTSRLDTYAGTWITTQQRICEATKVRGEQSDQALDHRMACLNGLLGHVQALADVLTRADATVVENAGQAVETLIPIERCTRTDAKPLYQPSPKDATELARLEQASRDLSSVYVQVVAGKVDQAKAALAALESAGLPEHPTSRAQLGYVRSQLLAAEGQVEPARTALESSIEAALTCSDDLQLFKSMASLALSYGDDGRTGEALRWLGLAEAVSARLGRPSFAELQLHNNATQIYARSNDFTRALDHGRRCVELGRADGDGLAVARCLLSLSVAQSEAGEYAAARTSLTEALELSVRHVGQHHDTTIRILGNLGICCAKAGDYAAAKAHTQQAIERRTALRGADSAELAGLYDQLGGFAQEQGDLKAALDYFERGHRIRLRNLGPEDLEVGFSLGNLAIVSLLSERTDEALVRARRSRQIIAGKLGPRHSYLINAHVIEGAIHRQRGALESSATSLRAAVTLADAILPAGHAGRANPRIELAKTAFAQGRLRQALTLTREVERMCAGGKVSPRETADNRFTRAQVQWEIGDDRPGAVALARLAHAAWAQMQLKQELAETQAWLAAHELPGQSGNK